VSETRPTVALVAHGIHDHGGMERAFSELIRRGHGEVDFVVLAAELAEELRPLVRWHRIRTPSRPIPLKILAFGAVAGIRLARTRTDLVHALGAIVPNRVDVATVQYCHAGDIAATGELAPAGSPPLRRLNSALKRLVAVAAERWCYRPGRVRAFAAVSPGVGRELAAHYPGVPTSVTPNGVDTDRFAPDAGERSATRARLAIPDDALVLVFLGGDWDRKGLAVAIEGLAAARARGLGPSRLLVVGRGDTRRFGGLAARAGVGDAVTFLGPRADVERWLRAGDVLVLPTLYETFSLAAHEAAAAALPVVATRVSGIEDLVGDDAAGVIVERGASSIADALLALRDPGARGRLGDEGRRRAAAFSWDRSVRSVLDVYASLRRERAA
jgi:UDP-glucose:(heptosyl)LPS alpha-1,3-glucosyltransferase